MRIIYFLDYGKSYGGAVNTLIMQSKLMQSMGFEVTYFLSNYYGSEMEEQYNKMLKKYEIEVRVKKYQISSHTEDIDLVNLVEEYENIKDDIIEIGADVLHSVQINPIVELISREINIPHIMNIYPLLGDFFSLNYMDIFPHYHICDSIYWAERWKKYLGTEYACIRTVSYKNMQVNDDKEKNYKFICVGTIYKEKNQLEVIKAFEKAIDKGIYGTLDIYGYYDGVYGNDCKNYIVDHNLTERICLKGFCSNLDKVYQNYGALICGSIRESYPNVISEALANNVVIISTPVGGVPEVIKDGYNGYLTNGYDSDDILKKILEYNNDLNSDRITNIRLNANNTYVNTHSEEAVKRQLMDFYKYVIGNNKHSSPQNIQNIIEEFEDEIKKFREKKIKNKKHVVIKLWYLHYIKDVIEVKRRMNSKFYVWGVGKRVEAVNELLNIYFPNIEVGGYLDSVKVGYYNGKKIYNPKDIIRKKNVVIFIAAMNGQNEMIYELNRVHKKFNEDYFIMTERYW